MPEQPNRDASNQDYMFFPNLVELWKDMYFKSENALAEAFKKFVSTNTFVQMLNQTLEQNLSMEKVINQNMDKYFDSFPVPSKKDIARVAELVLSIEDKVDAIDFQLPHALTSLADNVLALAAVQEKVKQELEQVRVQLDQVNSTIDSLTQRINNVLSEDEVLRGSKKKRKSDKIPADE